ncbi:MAG: hypothetical protein IJX98_04555 [Clostridia bacterium]|nr:hypothetical protein [Clostridia bacterium]
MEKIMKKTLFIENWKFCVIPNAQVVRSGLDFKTASDVYRCGYDVYNATVPGNFELDLMREGLLDDLYQGANVIKAQQLENLHLYYFTTFTYRRKRGFDAQLVFHGIDTVAEIYLDGKYFAFTENMLHGHVFDINDLEEGEHELFIHILPTAIYARKFKLPSMHRAIKYNLDAISIRKAPYMFGWDIMPRIVSGGIWKPVEIVYLPENRIQNPFIFTTRVDEYGAHLTTRLEIETKEDFLTDFTLVWTGVCKGNSFRHEFTPFCSNVSMDICVETPLLWWPKNYGEQNLYEMQLTLYYKGVECDKVCYKTGIRTVELKRTSIYRKGEEGDFSFYINDKKVFILGTNWVPTDAFPSRQIQYDARALELVNDIGCNAIRFWGGNIYPDEKVYEYCDEHGIMIWQDFAMACAHYPSNERICNLMRAEAEAVIQKYRNHPALIVWAGDNECDQIVARQFHRIHDEKGKQDWINPNFNRLTREIIFNTLRDFDATRPYLPSSPYVDNVAFFKGLPAETHLWGPRDFFKSEYYKAANCYFASEMGYHGCPAPKSIRQFIPEESISKIGNAISCEDPHWLAHASCMELKPDNIYGYRIPLMFRQVERLFKVASQELAEFAKQSQISQAEAMKFFIEHFRIAKGEKSGIIWWNIIDGWPQVSDAVVDWYGNKKLAYSYIKRSQNPFCIMMDEPEAGYLRLFAINDTQKDQCVRYTVKNLATGKTILCEETEVAADEGLIVNQIPEESEAFYLIEWEANGIKGVNHYVSSISKGIAFDNYLSYMQESGFDEYFEGF